MGPVAGRGGSHKEAEECSRGGGGGEERLHCPCKAEGGPSVALPATGGQHWKRQRGEGWPVLTGQHRKGPGLPLQSGLFSDQPHVGLSSDPSPSLSFQTPPTPEPQRPRPISSSSLASLADSAPLMSEAEASPLSLSRQHRSPLPAVADLPFPTSRPLYQCQPPNLPKEHRDRPCSVQAERGQDPACQHQDSPQVRPAQVTPDTPRVLHTPRKVHALRVSAPATLTSGGLQALPLQHPWAGPSDSSTAFAGHAQLSSAEGRLGS